MNKYFYGAIPNYKTSFRNAGIDLFRLFLSVSILLFHGRLLLDKNNDGITLFKTGGMAVEGFFMISGCFFCSRVFKKEEIKEIFKRQLYKIYPYAFFSLTIHLILEFIHCIQSGTGILNIFCLESDYLQLNSYGMQRIILSRPMWYLSSLFFANAVIFPFVRKFKDTFCAIYAPMVSALLYGIIFSTYGRIAFDANIGNYVQSNILLIRGIAGVLSGCFIYWLLDKIIGLEFKLFGKAILVLIEIVSIALASYLMWLPKIDGRYEMIVFFCLLNIAIIIFSNQGVLQKLRVNTKKLADFTLTLYLNHLYVYYIVNQFVNAKGLVPFLIYIVLSILMAFICLKVSTPIFGRIIGFLKKSSSLEEVI